MAKLGDAGYDWVEDIRKCYTETPSLCSTWQQEFFESFWEKADRFGEDAMVSDKQLTQLQKISDIYGIPYEGIELVQD